MVAGWVVCSCRWCGFAFTGTDCVQAKPQSRPERSQHAVHEAVPWHVLPASPQPLSGTRCYSAYASRTPPPTSPLVALLFALGFPPPPRVATLSPSPPSYAPASPPRCIPGRPPASCQPLSVGRIWVVRATTPVLLEVEKSIGAPPSPPHYPFFPLLDPTRTAPPLTPPRLTSAAALNPPARRFVSVFPLKQSPASPQPPDSFCRRQRWRIPSPLRPSYLGKWHDVAPSLTENERGTLPAATGSVCATAGGGTTDAKATAAATAASVCALTRERPHGPGQGGIGHPVRVVAGLVLLDAVQGSMAEAPAAVPPTWLT